MSDLIDREAVISKIEPWLYSEGRGESEINMLRAVIAELKSLPAAPRWVRCEERLPKPRFAREWYLVALESGCVKTLAFERDTNEWWETGSPVTHWMPLPEPPKEEA